MDNDPDYLDLGGGQVADLGSEGFWRSPERLRAAAIALRDSRFGRFASQSEPEPPSLEELIGHRRIDDVVDYEAEDSARRTARAHMEILMALEREKQEVEQQRQRDQADAYAKSRQTSLGRLLYGGYRHG
jgi:hypothetical protein